jgi:hypothetical protein
MAQTGPRKTLTEMRRVGEENGCTRRVGEREMDKLTGTRHLGSGKENGPLADAGAEEIYGHDWEHESRM